MRIIFSLKFLFLFLISNYPAHSVSCRTDAFGVTRCSNGQNFRTDSFGVTRDNHGNSCRRDSFGVTRCN